ncbi:hypothetical protein [uncultured Hoeflea sp.]|uniref:hypothetical protein n=1 Tax=uncultured Hoeflea sp. TaxID=538666 RepID=UPI0030DDB175
MGTVYTLCTAWTQELFDELLTIPVNKEFDPRIAFDGSIASLNSCYRRDQEGPGHTELKRCRKTARLREDP